MRLPEGVPTFHVERFHGVLKRPHFAVLPPSLNERGRVWVITRILYSCQEGTVLEFALKPERRRRVCLAKMSIFRMPLFCRRLT